MAETSTAPVVKGAGGGVSPLELSLDQVANSYDELAPIYDETFQTPIALAENEYVAERIPRHRLPLLDIGCGTGLLLEYRVIPCHSYIGIDISEGMLERAREKFPSYIFSPLPMELIGYCLSPGSQGAVVSLFGSICYAADPERALIGARRVLEPGGRLFWMFFGSRYRRRRSHIFKQHKIKIPFRTWSSDEIRRALSVSGFEDIKIEGLNCLGDYLPLPKRALKKYLDIEAGTIGRLWPDFCYHLIATARVPYA